MIQMRTEKELRKGIRSSSIALWCYLFTSVTLILWFLITMSTRILLAGAIGLWITSMIHTQLHSEITRLEIRLK